MQSLRKSAHISAAYCLLLLLLLPLVACSSHEDDNQSTSAHKTIKPNFHKLSPQMTSNIRVHGLLLWVSMGLLMPAGILSIRMSVREPRGSTPAKVFFYLHLILQMLAVLLATAGAVMSITNFENSFNNNHQRIGLALYIAIWVQALMGFLRPHKGKKERSVWYFVHWILGSLISLVGIINIYTGLDAYHKKTMRSTRLWAILFTAQVSLITFFYLYQDKREYIQQQGVILGNNIEAITPDQQNNNINNAQTNHSQKDLVPLPCAKKNALMNLFD